MSWLSQWAGNILYFLILVMVLRSILPSKAYQDYLKLFTGLVLILIVMQPVTRGLGLEELIDLGFEKFSFQAESQELRQQVLGIERERRAQVIGIYEQEVEDHVAAMAEEQGISVAQTKAVIGDEPEQENYGKIISIKIMLAQNPEGENKVQPVSEVSEIQVQSIQVDSARKTDGQLQSEDDAGAGKEPEKQEMKTEQEIRPEIAEFQRKVVQYYGLESDAVEVQF